MSGDGLKTQTANPNKERDETMKNAIIVAATILCLSFPAFAQSDGATKPKLSGNGELDFSEMGDRQMTEFIARQLYLLNKGISNIEQYQHIAAMTLISSLAEMPNQTNLKSKDHAAIASAKSGTLTSLTASAIEISRHVEERVRLTEGAAIPE